MTYIENIFLCLAIPMILSLFFIRGRSRSYTLFVTIGMGICLLSAYVNSFFMWLYGVDGTVAAIEITPVCEELLKLLPLLFYFLIFEPEKVPNPSKIHSFPKTASSNPVSMKQQPFTVEPSPICMYPPAPAPQKAESQR